MNLNDQKGMLPLLAAHGLLLSQSGVPSWARVGTLLFKELRELDAEIETTISVACTNV